MTGTVQTEKGKTMYDELIKRLRDWSRVCVQYDRSVDQLHDDAADAIEELSKQNEKWEEVVKTALDFIPCWIAVTERLPEPYSGEYLVAINDGSIYVDVLWFDSPGNGRYDSCFYKSDDDGYATICTDVIAWMPLPEPPKEVDDEHTD